MSIEILFFEGCPNHAPTVERVREVVRTLGLDADVTEVELFEPFDAARLHFLGSPSVRVNGVDIEPSARERVDFGFSCRTYSGGVGTPSIEMIEDALRSYSNDGSGGADASPPPVKSPPSGRTMSLVTSAGPMGFAALSSACCWLPLLLIGFGVSAGGVSGFLGTARPFLLGFTGLALAGAFYVVYRPKQAREACADCDTPTGVSSRFNRNSLWLATLGVIVFAAFPYYVDFLPAAGAEVPSGDALIVAEELTIPITGMTCSGCAVTLELALAQTPGVAVATVSYDEGRAVLGLDPTGSASYELLVQTIRNSGFDIEENSGSAD